MLWLVSDDLEDDLDGERKADLDTDELTSDLPKESQKVELDLEDAPFLEEEDEDEDEEEVEEAAPPLEEPEKDAKPWFRNLKIVLPGAGLLLVLLFFLGFFFWPSAEPPPEPEPEMAQEMHAPEVEEEPEEQEFLVAMEPFWVEQQAEDGTIRFLVCKFTCVTTSEKLSYEITQKTTVLRDAIFYYLKNKDLTFLSDQENVETLKADVLSVINQYLTLRLESLLIEQYLVK